MIRPQIPSDYQETEMVVREARANPINPPIVPQELTELQNRIMEAAGLYQELPAYKAYKDYSADIIKPDGMSRMEWFEAGKPGMKN